MVINPKLLIGLLLFTWQMALTQTPAKEINEAPLAKCLKESNTRSDDTVLIWFLPPLFDCASVPAGLSIRYEGRNPNQRFDFTPKKFTLDETLKTALSKEHGYVRKDESGVVNVLPEHGYALLQTRVGKFKVDAVSAKEAVDLLFSTAAVRSYLESNSLREADTPLRGGKVDDDRNELKIDLENPTVLEALNEIVRHHKRSQWLYYEMDSIVDGSVSRSFRVRVTTYR